MATIDDLPTLARYSILEADGELPQSAPAPQPKKDKKKKKGKGKQDDYERNAPLIDHPLESGASFGDLRLVQSAWKTDRVWTEIAAISAQNAGQTIWIRGRVHNVRQKGKMCFMVVRRGLATVQMTLFAGGAETDPSRDMVKYCGKIPPESVVDIYGKVEKTENKVESATVQDVEIKGIKCFVINASAHVLPFQLEDANEALPADEKNKQDTEEEGDPGYKVGMAHRLDYRWVDIRSFANHAIFTIQSRVGQFFRQYFIDRDFTELHSPKITPGVSEGGAEVFRLKYFGRDACLAQSPQLYKQMGVTSDLFRVFEIGPVFRAENSMTHRHMCEFTGLDFEMEIKEHYHEVLKVLGGVFVHIFDQLNKYCQPELAAVRRQWPCEPLKYRRETLVLQFPEAVKMLREAGMEVGEHDDFSTPNEKLLGKLVRAKYDTDFYIVDYYPQAARPFYTMPSPKDPKYTNSYDVFLRGEEITSGAQRIHDVDLLKKRAVECGIPLDNITSYLESFKYGAYPHGGAGIGLERVVMLFLGLRNIRMSSLHPRDPKRLSP